jgi:hypothetical protein
MLGLGEVVVVAAGCWPGFWLLCGFLVVCQQLPKIPPEKYPWRLDGSANFVNSAEPH